ncbi:MAG: hypothetical protein Q8S84_06005 [bacterium]|nr:hypothetical protein [bacterium]MDP3381033.1 hypothetical protein [bacterium]
MKFILSLFANCSIDFFNFILALTHPANITVLTLYCLAASRSFHDITSVTAFSNSYDISLLSSIDNSHFSAILLSTSLFTLLFNPEKLKLNSLFINHTRGKRHVLISGHPQGVSLHSFCRGFPCGIPKLFSYSPANLLIIGHPGYHSHIILAALSNASQPASSHELHIFSISHIDFI